MQDELVAEVRLALGGREVKRRGAILVLIVDDHGARRQEGLQATQVVLIDVRLEGAEAQRDHLIVLRREGEG